MAERIGDHAVAVAPELIRHFHQHRRARRDGAIEHGVDVAHVEMQRHRHPPSVAGDFIGPCPNSSTTKKRESPRSSSECMMRVPSGAVLRNSSLAPSALVYQAMRRQRRGRRVVV